ncbi:RdgB/HAM1 family non-canonical purine NTP pyrophosphatase [Puniceicoccales bacterium CK1056]|uniref:dITP/XTP pyrophosphatase n=1 Tax=Oceanipulchritudo coccoides TaxID=2706888 RepID=A0A6B2M3Q8_9BACT|nr:RdgB/HAM1 family non-canonical purine NTP pyrophosphatase [Oceanipulchritudo coccoides]NDV62734.1 RdgB/HAM1 family non-canonical purine NTP pyrophosphatase [Oceanipulchritudo coccoides]
MDIFLASGNPHKFEEFVAILPQDGLKINFHSAEVFGGMPEVEETGSVFEENARIKAEALEELLPLDAWALADDSGLMVDALNGQPGVHSSRYAGPACNAVANNIKLLNELRGVPGEERTARFKCVLCFKQKGGPCHFFSGSCEGHILLAPTGEMGFGYDPLFQPLGYDKSFAELGSAQKNSLSHRGQAISEWVKFLKSAE